MARRLALAPNIDAALAALGKALGLPEDAAFTIFAIGRVAGWTAHAIEQATSGEIIRPPRALHAAEDRRSLTFVPSAASVNMGSSRRSAGLVPRAARGSP